MADEKPIRVEQDYYVNEATLELLQRRIASGVKTSLVAWVGAPVGIMGLLAIGYALFFTIPPEIQKVASSYLQNPETGQAVVENAVAEFLSDPEGGQTVLKDKVQPAVTNYLNDPTMGRGTIQKQVTEFLASASGRKLIQDQVKAELKPTMTALLDPMKKNANKLVAQARSLDTPEGVERFEKGAVEQLFRFLRSPEGQRLKAEKFDISLSKHILRGPVYGAGAIRVHLDTLRQEFGDRFQHVVLYDSSDKFIARIEPGRFRSKLASQRDELMRLLNARPNEISLQQVKESLKRMFGPQVTDQIREDWTLVQALKKPTWGQPPNRKRRVAVVSADNKFLGTTTRGLLLKAIFGESGVSA